MDRRARTDYMAASSQMCTFPPLEMPGQSLTSFAAASRSFAWKMVYPLAARPPFPSYAPELLSVLERANGAPISTMDFSSPLNHFSQTFIDASRSCCDIPAVPPL